MRDAPARCPSAGSSNDVIASPTDAFSPYPRSRPRPNQPLGCHAPGRCSGPSPPCPRPNQPLGRHSLAPAPALHATSSTFLHRGPKHSTAAREMPDSQPEAAPVLVLAL
eukprot:scaffold1398_cov53-Phaeocystis_antarctica.AAC.2